MPKFIPGLQLNAMFFQDIIKPLMEQFFSKLQYSYGLVGEGSDVLGFDNETSMDHNWGPRGVLFLSEKDYPRYRKRVDRMLRNKLPYEYKGFSTNFSSSQPTYLRQQMVPIKSGPVNHLIDIVSVKTFFQFYLGFNPHHVVTYKDWLMFPQQALIEVTSGKFYHSGLPEVEELRQKFRYFPRDVWLYIMRIQWERIGSELSFPGRTGEQGDEVGSALVTARMINRVMTQCFLLEKQYVPYPKWFGTAFQKLIPARKMTPVLLRVLRAKNWKEREWHMGEAYQLLVRMHNALGITESISPKLYNFHGRGYRVPPVGVFMEALQKKIRNSQLRNLKHPIGSIDQFVEYVRISDLIPLWKKFKPLIQ